MTGEGLILPGDDELITPDDTEIIDMGAMVGGMLHALGEMEQRIDSLHERQMELENTIERLEEVITPADGD